MKDRLLGILRHLAIGTLTGVVAGAIAGGLGSRLAMRITALMTEEALQGRLTEAQARVGEITAEGTLFLVFFSVVMGIYGGLLYRATLSWMPAKNWLKGLGFGFVLLLVHGTMLIKGDNFDFGRFGLVLVNLGMFILIPIAFGLIAAYTESWLEKHYSVFVFRPKALVLYLPAILGVTLLVLLTVNAIQSLASNPAEGIFGSIQQVWLSLVMIAVIVLSVLFRPNLKLLSSGLSLQILMLVAPAIYGTILLLDAIREILH
jgi:hypothetical protein